MLEQAERGKGFLSSFSFRCLRSLEDLLASFKREEGERGRERESERLRRVCPGESSILGRVVSAEGKRTTILCVGGWETISSYDLEGTIEGGCFPNEKFRSWPKF